MLDRLFNPRSVAIIGASNVELKSGWMFLKSLIDSRFEGIIYPVNPGSSEVIGLKSYPSVFDIPGEVDLAVITVPVSAVCGAMADCARKGVWFVIIHTAGFSEVGIDGKELEERVVEIARDGGTRVIGPNCMGIYSPRTKINTIVPHFEMPMEEGATSFVGQSGWGSETFIIEGYERGLRFSKVVSSGNQSDLEMVDYLEYFGGDPETGVIAAYVEGVRDGQRLIRVAEKVSKDKPVMIWKAGRTTAGARAVASHTGSLAGGDEVCDAAFKQAGIIRADNLYELIDFAVAFNCPIPPLGRRIGILVESGGGAVAASDSCEGFGLEVPVLPEDVQEELREFLDKIGSPSSAVGNPIDLVWPPFAEIGRILPRSIEIASRAVDAILMVTYYPLSDEDFASIMAELGERIKKPIFVVPTYPTSQWAGMRNYTMRGIPSFPSPERAAKAMSVFVKYYERFEHGN